MCSLNRKELMMSRHTFDGLLVYFGKNRWKNWLLLIKKMLVMSLFVVIYTKNMYGIISRSK